MHPLDAEDRIELIKNQFGIGLCNITKCCTEVCPEHIAIADNAIIPLKERVVDRFYDPIKAPAPLLLEVVIMFQLKHISSASISRSLAKAERYRLLNEPSEAESNCLDVLEVDPDNQEALIASLLALTDEFSESPGVDVIRPTEILRRLSDSYAGTTTRELSTSVGAEHCSKRPRRDT